MSFSLRIALLCSRACAILFLATLVPGASLAQEEREDSVPELMERARTTDDLSNVINAARVGALAASPPTRQALTAARARSVADLDPLSTARVHALLSQEAFVRANAVLQLWIPRRDPSTGLFPTSTQADGRVWAYGDTGSDLFPHLAIAARLLAPTQYSIFLDTLTAERRRGTGLPDDITIPTGEERRLPTADRIFGTAEFAKDGLLPLIERTGRDPWLGRMVEVTDAILARSSVPTRNHGLIAADSTEVNGDMLQVLARLYWLTGEDKYLLAADQIAETYLDDVLPHTTYLPPNRWDFIDNEPIERRRFRLSDHGNEIVSGLVEWHIAATLAGRGRAPEHRETIRRMLDRLLDRARNEDGLWRRVIEIPSGRIEQDGLTDSWGYLFQAYLAQAKLEESIPGGDVARAKMYREAAHNALSALPRYRFYQWERGKMDGYADSIEGALYVLNESASAEGEAWVLDQIGVLFGYQDATGRVLDRDLDGNFIRTALLYGYWLTQGARAEPWTQDVYLGSAQEGGCLVTSVSAAGSWSGRVVFDTPRHRENLHLPFDYPRLNKWLEWFTAADTTVYEVQFGGGVGRATGSQLAEGLPLRLAPGDETVFRVCPTNG
ncbi:MAG: hypothetical protein U0821_08020 [Chloroflexota bacterium]